MNYDDLLASIGNFSSYQLRNYIILCIPIILCAFHKLSNVFILAKMDHRCRLQPEEFRNASFSLSNDILSASYPFDDVKGTFSNCSYYSDHYLTTKSQHEELKCAGDYIWDDSKFSSSALMDFELVCDREVFKASSNSLFMVGVFIGSFLFGHLSDKYGRKKVFVLSLISQLIFGFMTAFAKDFVTFTIFRMVSWSGFFFICILYYFNCSLLLKFDDAREDGSIFIFLLRHSNNLFK